MLNFILHLAIFITVVRLFSTLALTGAYGRKYSSSSAIAEEMNPML
jgi:hypothetical protein